MLKQKLDDDLKQARLDTNKELVELIGMLKSAILYKEVELGVRDAGLTDDQVIEVLSKEAKKRQEAATMYKEGGDEQRAAKEISEKESIEKYLPAQLSEEEIGEVVEGKIAELNPEGLKDMGKVIGAVKSELGNTADGAIIAQLVKQKLA
jgi:uncharacterized protein YqeY